MGFTSRQSSLISHQCTDASPALKVFASGIINAINNQSSWEERYGSVEATSSKLGEQVVGLAEACFQPEKSKQEIPLLYSWRLSKQPSVKRRDLILDLALQVYLIPTSYSSFYLASSLPILAGQESKGIPSISTRKVRMPYPDSGNPASLVYLSTLYYNSTRDACCYAPSIRPKSL